MTKRMLIDGLHPEESRVVIMDDRRILDFDFTTTAKKQIKGNIYLAKITRVEPSLQAAFVEYGGGKQGFLPFAEIHPDYYQIPFADRQKLMEEAAAAAERENSGERYSASGNDAGRGDAGSDHFGMMPDGEATYGTETLQDAASVSDDFISDDAQTLPSFLDRAAALEESSATDFSDAEQEDASTGMDPHLPSQAERVFGMSVQSEALPLDRPSADAPADAFWPEDDTVSAFAAPPSPHIPAGDEQPEIVSTESEMEAFPIALDAADMAENDVAALQNGEPRGEDGVETVSDDEQERRTHQRFFTRRYKIQEVIKRNQIVLVQVIKEERGNKGVSLSTYISLAGRYCVLMPNSPKEGGISRKIMNNEDRRRLKQISSELRVTAGMSAIIRTAGIDRTRAEIKRDFDYLVKLWNSVRENTLNSTAPALVYEESDLIKRSIRDLYQSDIDEIIVEGDAAYHTSKDFMKLIMPSHAPRVKHYKGSIPLFYAHDIEEQLISMYDPAVRLRSGGYLVINPTEALIAIDVNSGRATGERNIEETATKTNLEAANEIARQLRLRDLAGLIVIDFIDMMDSRHRRSVERALKDALKQDRAKIQVGRISPFGLLEMSRQRLRPSISETSMTTCPHCQGKGVVRSPESASVQILRALEKEAAAGQFAELRLILSTSLALYLLNHKREMLSTLESQYSIRILSVTDDSLLPGAFRVEKNRRRGSGESSSAAVEPRDSAGRRPRRGRGRGFSAQMDMDAVTNEVVSLDSVAPDDFLEADDPAFASDNAAPRDGVEEGSGDRPRRTRGRRGKRGGSRERGASAERSRDYAGAAPATEFSGSGETDSDHASADSSNAPATTGEPGEPKRSRRGGRGGRGRRRWKDGPEGSGEGTPRPPRDAGSEPGSRTTPVISSSPAQPAAAHHGSEWSSSHLLSTTSNLPMHSAHHEGGQDGDESKSKKKGWWRRIVES